MSRCGATSSPLPPHACKAGDMDGPETTHPFLIPPHLGLRVCRDDGRGRHIVITRSFKAGELVLAQQPFAAVLHDAQVPLRCNYCYLCKPDLLQCSRSRFARYCSRAHQKASWTAGYKQECSALTALPPDKKPTPTMRLVARCAWKAARELEQEQSDKSEKSGLVTQPEQWSKWPAPGGTWAQHVISLLDHWQLTPPHTQLLYAQVAVAAREFALGGVTPPPPPPAASEEAPDKQGPRDTSAVQGPPSAPGVAQGLVPGAPSTTPGSGEARGLEADGLPGVRQLARLVARLAANTHTICDEELRPLGMGLYPLAAMANHSCDPSCLQSFLGDVMCFRALRDLSAGDEVTIPYIELGTTRQIRREALWDQYRFDVEPSDVQQLDTGVQQQHTNVQHIDVVQQQHSDVQPNGTHTATVQQQQPEATGSATAVQQQQPTVGSSSTAVQQQHTMGSSSEAEQQEAPGTAASDEHQASGTAASDQLRQTASDTPQPPPASLQHTGPALEVLRPPPASVQMWSYAGGWAEDQHGETVQAQGASGSQGKATAVQVFLRSYGPSLTPPGHVTHVTPS